MMLAVVDRKGTTEVDNSHTSFDDKEKKNIHRKNKKRK